ncbi:MAG: aromatic aminobenezylarsenical efflux permease ArsG family transporter [Acidobacteriota bacterium]|nr:aromatic aminobenezylarsenical efflux permease ArsG family transporter [Acidobacteriota bacterium]MDQ7086370.1 aromatic aminobenezylarsenical efflux permease ArsG family transporter [Acidobacteriota bacterium]
MIELFWASMAALWLGVLVSISPCPLASNIAAVAYIGRESHRPWRVLAAGLAYVAGRVTAYTLLGALIAVSVVSMIDLSGWLEGVAFQLLGPGLIVTGLFLLGWLGTGGAGSRWAERLRRRGAAIGGMAGAVVLGLLLALSLCPVSAALFFGSLVPLSLKHGSAVVVPAVFGVGTGLPAFVFALLFAGGARGVARAYSRLESLDRVGRRFSGWVFIAAGVYESACALVRWW